MSALRVLSRQTVCGLRGQRLSALNVSLFCRSYAASQPQTKFATSHEWVTAHGDGTGTVGITDFAQAALGDIVYVDIPEPGKKVKKGESAGVVESVKAASEIYSPVSGEIISGNGDLVKDPALANKEPLTGGWFFKIKISDPSELDALLDKDAYAKHTAKDH
mmetsp:Transcript_143/g.268  ORF Transcript_143/g.268 Transcript_143/m.268 type:complete len:162 (-) Transcript_143:310-795(-)|eukprot:CAMPEP_0184349460 /NCGR_PEP_ID=MMETSP1089-20130417/33216_1 /TAXON_ID=38269 ORGANISM="Gloeochaete wittrockiana, Strain SAG46.84" /NCGR_SAMPLE_ID=MMETSP1089 /ASSEMBLY_ACC=CAM_ASM_000445 /LENGTH=161 /DNA_ID=CAMNT_0026681663 /DNA_START=56 /DNA_END=541 /DNA_ORIENTATION=+